MKLNDTSSTVSRLRDVSKTVSKIDPADVKAAIGARDTGVTFGVFSPVTLYQVRAELARRLASSVGQPASSHGSPPVRIPLSDKQWAQLERIAEDVSVPGCTTSAGQVAGILITLSLRSLTVEHADELAAKQ